jgi:hypothetical protein
MQTFFAPLVHPIGRYSDSKESITMLDDSLAHGIPNDLDSLFPR